MDIAPSELTVILDLYGRGLCLQAYQRAVRLAPLHEWTGTEARITAGRLAINLGAPKLAAWQHYHAWRKDPTDPNACYYYARLLLQRRGPFAAWKFMRRIGELPDAPPPVRSDWLAFHGCVAGILRDFESAEAWLAQAEQACPDRPWTCIERSTLFEMEDRYEDALAAARRALELHPWYRPAVQSVAHVLQLLGREREALELLTEAAGRIENGPVMVQLAAWQTELHHYADAARSYERFAELSPLMEKEVLAWLAARRSDTAYYLGDFAQAAEHAKQVGEPFYTKLAERLTASNEGKRVELPVGFVRQHHMTCAPATLSAISRFWNKPADHLAVAEAICYDGTPNYNERQWAEEQGYRTREFTVTWDSAVALIDRGVPFTLTTVELASAHLQAVIGYDSRRGSLLIRDPYERHLGEFAYEEMARRYRSTGPRGMALVPQEQAHLLDGLDLPDAALYDHFYALQLALKRHDRARAAECYAALRREAPEHRLTVLARRCLAGYDANPTEVLACAEQMLRLFPDDGLAQLSKVHCLRELGRREERLELLQQMCAKKDSDPICWQQYAQELSADARERVRVNHLLRRCIRYRPTTASNYSFLANVRWDERRFADGLELYRIAACLDDKDEGLARSYFIASRHLRQTGAALQMLQHRFQRLGPRSSWPVRTLFWAHSQLEQMNEAFAALEAALQLPSADGDLRLYAAEMYGSWGKTERAAELLEAAKGQTQHASWLRTAASLAAMRGDRPAALELWRQVLDAEPLAVDAHRNVVLLLAETQGRAAALEHLRQTCERFPHHFGLHQLWIEWLRDEGATAVEPVVRKVIASHPSDAWARRELALALAEQRRFDAAYDQLEFARRLEPANISHYLVRGRVCNLAGRIDEAKKAYREAIRLSADSELAIAELVACCDNLAERREALAFIEAELIRQTLFGDGLLAYREQAQYTLPPEELLALLRRGLEARPDLWHAWSAVIRQLTSMERFDEAAALARQAAARFPLLPRIWLDLANVCRAQQDGAGERDALRRALEISPGWGMAVRQLAALHEREGDLAESRRLLEQAVARSPLDAYNHGCLADVLWRLGEREAALERVQQALRLEPGYEWGWNALNEWSAALGRPEVATHFARELTVRRAGEARSWLMLARTLARPEELEERLAALNQALALNPRLAEAYDLKAELLAGAERYDAALDACRASVWDGQPPLFLRGRAAWVEGKRGNVQEAIALMRQAVAEDPNYYWGWEQLARWYRSEGANAEYLEAAGNLVRLAPQNPTALAYAGEAKQRTGDCAGAKEDYRRALDLAPDFIFVALNLFDMQLEDNELDAAAATLELLRKHEGKEATFFRAAQLAARRKERDAALKELDAVLQLDPRFGEAIDLKAELLTEARRYDEAREACLAPVGDGQPVPVFLRGRAAWVEAQRGNRDEAIRQMRAVLAEDPDYYWGWRNLADWYCDAQQNAEYLEAAAALVRLAPQNPRSLAYAGEAKQRTGDRAGAKEDYRRALELAPAWTFPAIQLFDMQLEDDELDAAAATLELHKQHVRDEYVRYREVKLAVRRNDPAAGRSALADACASTALQGKLIEDVVSLLDEAGWAAQVDQVLDEALHGESVNSQVGPLWIERRLAAGDWGCVNRLDALLEKGAIGKRALVAYVNAAGKQKRKAELDQVLKKYRDALRADTWSWGNVGYALTTARDYRAAIEWMADWSGRDDAEPWMLLNLVLALRGLERTDEAFRVGEHALGLPENDFTTPYHETWLAVDEALAGQVEAAAERLEGVDADELDPYHRLLRLWAEVVLEVAKSKEGGRAFDAARRRLRESAGALEKVRHDPALLLTYRRVVRRIAQACGGVRAMVWARWRSSRPLLPKAE
jgi:tetratricopeptide (TPR) repeat protein